MTTPWKLPPPPMPGSNDRPGVRAEREPPPVNMIARAEAEGLTRIRQAVTTRTLRRHRVWRPLEDTAARLAAPWWALVWVLTLGRMGAPLWRREEDPQARESRDFWHRHATAQLGSGVGYQPVPISTAAPNEGDLLMWDGTCLGPKPLPPTDAERMEQAGRWAL